MSSIAFPAFRDTARRGTVVVVQLDPAASLAALNDAAVGLAASRMATRKRLAIVDDPLVLRPEIASHTFYPIGRGLPSDAWASVAIFPVSSHPEDRAPVSVSGPLPFGEPYVHTAHTFYGAVSRIYTSAPSEVHLSAEETAVVCVAEEIDYMRLEKQGVHDAGDGSISEREEDISDSPLMQTTFVDPHYRIWLDLSQGDDLADPSTLDAELEQLHELEAEWRQRRSAEGDAKERRLAQWRTAQADETWEYDADEYITEDSVVGEDCLAPEDADDEPIHREQESDRSNDCGGT